MWTKRCCKRTAIVLVIVSVSAIVACRRSTAFSAIAVIKRPIFYVIRRIEDDFDFVFIEINFLDKGIDEYLFIPFFADVQESKRNEELIALIHGDLLSLLVPGFQQAILDFSLVLLERRNHIGNRLVGHSVRDRVKTILKLSLNLLFHVLKDFDLAPVVGKKVEVFDYAFGRFLHDIRRKDVVHGGFDNEILKLILLDWLCGTLMLHRVLAFVIMVRFPRVRFLYDHGLKRRIPRNRASRSKGTCSPRAWPCSCAYACRALSALP